MRFSSTTSTKAERENHEATDDRFKAARAANHSQREFAEIDVPRKLVMTRKFEQHPLLGTRETTITYRLDPITTGTRIAVLDEGFIGRSEATFGNGEHWERVLGWLNT